MTRTNNATGTVRGAKTHKRTSEVPEVALPRAPSRRHYPPTILVLQSTTAVFVVCLRFGVIQEEWSPHISQTDTNMGNSSETYRGSEYVRYCRRLRVLAERPP